MFLLSLMMSSCISTLLVIMWSYIDHLDKARRFNLRSLTCHTPAVSGSCLRALCSAYAFLSLFSSYPLSLLRSKETSPRKETFSFCKNSTGKKNNVPLRLSQLSPFHPVSLLSLSLMLFWCSSLSWHMFCSVKQWRLLQEEVCINIIPPGMRSD